MIWCDRCKRRFTVQRAVGQRGGVYYYFLCVGRARGVCDHPYIPVEVVEQAVIDHYAATIGIPADFKNEIRTGLDTAMASDFAISDHVRDAFTKRLAVLKRKESYFLDLAAEEDWDKNDLRTKIDKLRSEGRDITRQPDAATRRLDIGREIITHILTLLDQLARLYQNGDEATRTIFNATFFTRLYINGERVTHHDDREPFNVINGAHSLYRTYTSHGPTTHQPGGSGTPAKTTRAPKKTGGKAAHITSTNDSRAATPNEDDGPTTGQDPLALLHQTTQVKGWNKATLVEAMQELSRPSRLVRRLLELAVTWPNVTERLASTPAPTYRTARQLRLEEIDHLIAAYQAGSTVYELAARFGIHRSTVGRLLRSRGVDTTPPGLNADQLACAVRLYETGLPLSAVAAKLCAPQSTVRERLLAAGVQMRAARKPHSR